MLGTHFAAGYNHMRREERSVISTHEQIIKTLKLKEIILKSCELKKNESKKHDYKKYFEKKVNNNKKKK